MTIRFLILSYNHSDLTISCLTSLQTYEPMIPISILDNNSLPEERAKLTSYINQHSAITLYKQTKNLGVAGGRNYLISHTMEDIYIFLDNDTELTGIITNQLFCEVSKPKVGIAGKEAILFDPNLNPYAINADHKPVDATTGYCFTVTKRVVEKVGMFDEKYSINYEEDLDFCLRAKMHGYEIRAIPALPLLHKEHQASILTNEQKKQQEENHKRFVDTWIHHPKLLEVERQRLTSLSCIHCTDRWSRISK